MENQEQIVVKMEMESNGEIILYYVDENGGNEEGVVTTVKNIEQGNIGQVSQENYVTEEVDDTSSEIGSTKESVPIGTKDRWSDEDIRRLLVFYTDNKETFINGVTKKKHLWTVACKTMLTSKTPNSCEMKLRNMKKKYAEAHVDLVKGKGANWPHYSLCNHAFHDDSYVRILLSQANIEPGKTVMNMVTPKPDQNGTFTVKKVNRSLRDQKVEQMLQLYIQYKNKSSKDHLWQKHLWPKIAIQLGEDDEYWHKRFLNFKQHYIRMLDKRKESGPESINWPYMSYFDEIFEDDADFQKKYANAVKTVTYENNSLLVEKKVVDWNDTERTVLVKYCFDCFDEFQDSTIPNTFLWTELGRLLDKKPNMCKQKYEELKNDHLHLYIAGGYNLRTRKPIAILFDNIISKETEKILSEAPISLLVNSNLEQCDELVKFFHDNTEVFKDPICHFVCWQAISKKLNQNIYSCRHQWEQLTSLYYSILEDKKENPDTLIEWSYIDMFDRIFDYGMDIKLLEGYEKRSEYVVDDLKKVGVKKLKMKTQDDLSDNGSDGEECDEKGIKRSRGIGDIKQIKILEYYHKNKESFAKSQRKKHSLWDVLGNQIGISAEQCAHRFRNLKQVYTTYIQREINKPEMPILWPYYSLCKKVFGYRAIKSKLKTDKMESDDSEEWTPKEIKQLINYLSRNFHDINLQNEDKSWSPLAREIIKSESACREKFLDLKKSYKKVKLMMTRNPASKVNWKYYKLLDEIFSKEGLFVEVSELTNVDGSEKKVYMPLDVSLTESIKTELQDDEEYQCIIVMPEGQELSDLQNVEIVPRPNPEKSEADSTDPQSETPRYKWKQSTKKTLVIHYLNYLRSHKGKVINTKEMWEEISTKLPKSALTCKKMYFRLKNQHLSKVNGDDIIYNASPLCKLFKKILTQKPIFFKPKFSIEDISLAEKAVYNDISLPGWRVEKAFKFYIEHLEEFSSPKYEKKYVWQEMAEFSSLPVRKLFRKINFLRQAYKNKDEECQAQYGEILKEIFEKEAILSNAVDELPKQSNDDHETVSWLDEEVKGLLSWYLENLDKFKNPKYVTSYLWKAAAEVLQKSALACSKKMSEIRTQYSTMVKETPEALASWNFHELCQKIYGTGKKSTPVNSD